MQPNAPATPVTNTPLGFYAAMIRQPAASGDWASAMSGLRAMQQRWPDIGWNYDLIGSQITPHLPAFSENPQTPQPQMGGRTPNAVQPPQGAVPRVPMEPNAPLAGGGMGSGYTPTMARDANPGAAMARAPMMPTTPAPTPPRPGGPPMGTPPAQAPAYGLRAQQPMAAPATVRTPESIPSRLQPMPTAQPWPGATNEMAPPKQLPRAPTRVTRPGTVARPAAGPTYTAPRMA